MEQAAEFDVEKSPQCLHRWYQGVLLRAPYGLLLGIKHQETCICMPGIPLLPLRACFIRKTLAVRAVRGKAFFFFLKCTEYVCMLVLPGYFPV